MRTIKLFAESTSHDFFSSKVENIKREINAATKAQLSDELFIKSIIRKNKLELPTFDFNTPEKELVERKVSTSLYPPTYYFSGKSHILAKAVLYKVSYKGDSKFLELRPDLYTSGGAGVADIDDLGGKIIFEFIDIDNKPETIKNQYNSAISKVSTHHSELEKEINNWNERLDSLVNSIVNSKKTQIQKDDDFLNRL